MTRWQRVFKGWRMLDRVDCVVLTAVCAVGIACSAVGALIDWQWFIIGGLWLGLALELYLIVGVAILHPNPPGFDRLSEPFHYTEHRDPNPFDAAWHYQSADYWLRVAEESGRSAASTTAAACIAQGHAALGSLAFQIATQTKRRSA